MKYLSVAAAAFALASAGADAAQSCSAHCSQGSCSITLGSDQEKSALDAARVEGSGAVIVASPAYRAALAEALRPTVEHFLRASAAYIEAHPALEPALIELAMADALGDDAGQRGALIAIRDHYRFEGLRPPAALRALAERPIFAERSDGSGGGGSCGCSPSGVPFCEQL